MEWKYYDPVFECDKYNRDMLKFAPWSGHRGFAYDLVSNLQPETIVELGSFYGCSTFAFAQAIKDQRLLSKIWAVDIWKAFESYTWESYREDVYGSFLSVKEKCYPGDFVHALKMTFEQARDCFKKNSVDLLHIDGSHHYEDVKRDFTQWLPYMKDKGIILFHDISENIVNGSIMGTHTFWNELKTLYSKTLEFDFSCGLGILCLNTEIFEILSNVDFSKYYKKNNIEEAYMKDILCQYSFMIRDKSLCIDNLKSQIEIKDYHLNRYKIDTDNLKRDYEKTIMAKDLFISELEQQNRELEQNLKDSYEKTIAEKDKYINELTDRLQRVSDKSAGERERIVRGYQEEIKRVKQDYQRTMDGKDSYIADLEERLNNIQEN